MPLIADLIDPAAAERLAAAVQEHDRQRQADEAASPTPATCQACGQRLPGATQEARNTTPRGTRHGQAVELAIPAAGHGEAPHQPAAVVFLAPAEPMASPPGC